MILDYFVNLSNRIPFPVNLFEGKKKISTVFGVPVFYFKTGITTLDGLACKTIVTHITELWNKYM